MEKRIYFITGASGVGKTTLLKSLKSMNPDSSVFHFDSIGVPPMDEMIREFGSGEKWQEATTCRWIDRLINSDEQLIYLEGQVNLDFIKKGFRKYHFENYSIVLLDCHKEEMTRRLIDRGQPELANKDMFNWLNFLRVQAIDQNCHIINTSENTEEETLNQFLHITG